MNGDLADDRAGHGRHKRAITKQFNGNKLFLIKFFENLIPTEANLLARYWTHAGRPLRRIAIGGNEIIDTTTLTQRTFGDASLDRITGIHARTRGEYQVLIATAQTALNMH